MPGDDALALENWRLAAELFSKEISQCRDGLSAGQIDLAAFCSNLSGRSVALTEMGRARGQLDAQPAVLKAGITDARAAVSLAQRLAAADGKLVLKVVRALHNALEASGEAAEEAQQAAAALAGKCSCSELVMQELQQLARGIDTRKLCEEMDADVNADESPGTFRWPRRMPLPALPAGKPDLSGISDEGWGPYLRQRGGEKMIAAARSNAMMLDGLSFPLSLAWILLQESVVSLQQGDVHVVLLGATSKAEVRILQESTYWQELVMLLESRCNIRLHFVGPEISPAKSVEKTGDIHSMQPPCAKRFFMARSDLTPENTICAVFNGGFGNFVSSRRDELFWSWMPDLLFLADSHFLCVFFCANDYADLKGEVAIHRALGSLFALAPRRNPFAMATVYSGEDDSEWFSGNSFMYATCGSQKSVRHPAMILAAEASDRPQLMSAVMKLAEDDEASVEVAALPVRLHPSPALKEGASAKAAGYAPESTPSRVTCGEMKAMEGGWRFEVPMSDSSCVEAADLQISDTGLSFVAGGERILVEWPQAVDSTTARASYSSRSSKLVVKVKAQ